MAVTSRIPLAHLWRTHLLLLFVSLAIALFTFRHTIASMVQTWSQSKTYSHCFLILPIFFYLIWHRRHRVAELVPVIDRTGLLFTLISASLWALGTLGEAKIVQEFALVALIISCLWTFLGNGVVRSLTFPLLFLFFAVPFGTSLIGPLQDFTSLFVISALNVSHVPAILENHIISLPSGVWKVAEACSGIRFLLSSVVLGLVFSFLVYRSWKRRIVFMCASILLPVIGNGLRAYGTILLAHLINNRLAAGVDHVVYGAFFAVFIQLILMFAGLRWREAPIVTQVELPKSTRSPRSLSAGHALVSLAAACAILVAAPALATYLWSRSAATVEWGDPTVTVIGAWQQAAVGDSSWTLRTRTPDKELSAAYVREAKRVDLDWSLFSSRKGLEFGASPDGLRRPDTWQSEGEGIVDATIDGQRSKVTRKLVEWGQNSRIVWTWYTVGGENTASRSQVRLLQAKARLTGKSADVVIVTVASENRNDQDSDMILGEFLRCARFPTPPAQRIIAQQARLAPSSHIDEDSETIP